LQSSSPYRGERSTSNRTSAGPLLEYDKEKYREMILDAVETDLSIFGFDGRRIMEILERRIKAE
jgi:hypothetical protein